MPETNTDPRRDAHVAESLATAREVAALIADKPHATTIDALLMVVKAIAIQHACCTEAASTCCMSLAVELSNAASRTVGAGGGVVH